MSASTTTGKIVKTERMRSSVNGNPRFRATLADGRKLVTVPDAAVAYGFENSEIIGSKHRDIPVPLLKFHLDGRGQIEYIDIIDPTGGPE